MSSDVTPQSKDSVTRVRNPSEGREHTPEFRSDTKIRVRGLTKQFNTKNGVFTAVDDISLDIPSGKFFMIVGPSG